jgi:hypothetical protein
MTELAAFLCAMHLNYFCLDFQDRVVIDTHFEQQVDN